MEKNQTSTYNGADLENALRSDKFTKSSISITGMVKPSEQKGYILFAQSNCDEWIAIPVKLINVAEYIGNTGCKDHSHPVMKISFKEPDSEEGKVLLNLLHHANRSFAANRKQQDVAEQVPLNHGYEMFTPPATGIPSLIMQPRRGVFANRGLGLGGGSFDFGGTLPTCSWQKISVPCGSPLPGYPTPMCEEYFYCCTWPNGSRGCI